MSSDDVLEFEFFPFIDEETLLLVLLSGCCFEFLLFSLFFFSGFSARSLDLLSYLAFLLLFTFELLLSTLFSDFDLLLLCCCCFRASSSSDDEMAGLELVILCVL